MDKLTGFIRGQSYPFGDAFVSIKTGLQDLGMSLLERIPSIALGALLLLIIIFVASPLSRILLKPFNYVTKSDLIRSVSRRAVSLLIILLGCYLFLKLAGLTEFAVAIISGTGVLGLILGFAFRDIAENFISSLLLTVQRPFKLGDIVKVNEYTGVVQKVTTRATTLVDFDGNHIQIPNAIIYKGVVKNFTTNHRMRGTFVIGIGYDNDAKAAQQLAMQLLSSHPHVLDDPEPQVLVDNLGSSTINLKIYFWINVEVVSVLKMASVLMRDIVALFEGSGISMPDDAREIIFPEGINVIQSSEQKRAHEEVSHKESNVISRAYEPGKVKSAKDSAPDDVSSEAQSIRQQAAQTSDPKSGENIL
ncbi:mechanosensitive ion channel family protein [Alteromonas sp. ASW11-130]|uniref:mechanosensitive ion channel family protein n=1 Tax=Alteromonas sp. ASW11-130 TaxID=3015775 RepID=UPI00224261A1|nr:mechanosensitive ion channel family protein [Alteromonas sp. ASW11-130]MCW8090633.1 mechanosensitive ion channel family protein [Alteromonas sp. ASW11-130]